MALLEIACFNPDSAVGASKAGADRIELCQDQAAGGITPSFESLGRVKQHVTIPVFVMIRPRGGDFTFSQAEFERMKRDIEHFKHHVDGYVFGMLDNQHAVDKRRTTELVKCADPLPCTFHRAFDETQDVFQALEDVISTGCHAILTSGGAMNAAIGAEVISTLVQQAGDRIAIMPGGGVRASNIYTLQQVTKATAFHSSALVNGHTVPQADEIRKMKKLLSPDGVNEADGEGNQTRESSAVGNDSSQRREESHTAAVSIGNTPVDEVKRHLE